MKSMIIKDLKASIILPILLFIVTSASGLYLVYLTNRSWRDFQVISLDKIAVSHASLLEHRLSNTLSAAYILGAIIKERNGQTDHFDIYAKDIIDSIGDITNLQLAPDGIIKYIYPLRGHEMALGHNLITDDARSKEANLAIQTKKLTLAGPFKLVQGGVGIIGRYPIFLERRNKEEYFWGFASVLIYFNQLLQTVDFENKLGNKYQYQLTRIHPDTGKLEIISSNKQQGEMLSSSSKEIKVPNGAWYLKIFSKDANFNIPGYYLSIASVLGFSFLLSLIIRILQRKPIELEEQVNIKTEELNKLASYDVLTNLVNRREFESRIERLINTSSEIDSEHAFCYMDLDQFKVINDTCGHAAGDELLRQISNRMNENIRKRDTLARLGGDEFGLLMEHCPLENAINTASKIINSMKEFQFPWEGKMFRVGISIGLVSINKSITSLSELMKFADTACYISKEKGGNYVHVYQPDDREISRRHSEMQWVERINHAFNEGLFKLYAQLILPVGPESKNNIPVTYGYEILVRMLEHDNNNKHKIIMPGSFLPAAERYKLISRIDTLVFEKVLNILSGDPDQLKDIKFLSINISGQSLADNSFFNNVVSALAHRDIDTSKICFEITETATILNLGNANRFINTLKGLGCWFSLDDFGSGLSSFAYLKNLPVNFLKIDGMFVKDITNDMTDYAMVKSINDIGHTMGLETIAEFVENNEIKDRLIEIGVDYVQGYGIAKPKPIEEILKAN